MDGIHFQGSCGKGVTEELALASGYAELYERFCNRMPHINNLNLINKMTEISQQENGYYFNSKEKKLSIKDVFNNTFLKENLNKIIPNDDNLEEYLNMICNKNIIGVPYKGFNVEDEQYLDPRIIAKIISSTGMSSGNTLEEALNQGISEIFERYAYEQIFINEQKEYY